MAQWPVRIVPQGEISSGTSEPPPLILPDPKTCFTIRAARYAGLASSHVDGDFLRLMERLARAQQRALDTHPMPAPPQVSRLEFCRLHGMPPLGKDDTRSPLWRDALSVILDELQHGTPEPIRRAIADLEQASDTVIDTMADRLLAFDYPALDPVSAPLLAAALQVHWVRRSAALGEDAIAVLDVANLCPVCGAPPVASVLKLSPVPGMRYLHCVLCSAEWRRVRGECTECDAREKVSYLHIEGSSQVVRAEACDACRVYLKIVDMEKDPMVDPVADDLATLALDMLVDELGYQRASPNLFFFPGRT